MRRRRAVLRLGATYVGAVVGAAFASGQEHIRFFDVCSRRGAFGVLLAGAMFVLAGVLLADLASRKATSSPGELYRHLIGPALARPFDALLVAFMFSCLSVMLAGAGALVEEEMGLPPNVGVAFTGTIAAISSWAGTEGLLSANAVMTPVLVAAPAIVAAAAVAAHLRASPHEPSRLRPGPAAPPVHRVPWPWPVAAVLYVSYNLLLAAGVFAAVGIEIRDDATARCGGFVGGVTLAVLLALLHIVLTLHGASVWASEIPMLAAAGSYGRAVEAVYAIAILFAMGTTAAASAFALSRRFARVRWLSQRSAAILVVTGSTLFAQCGFGPLVARVYPLFGYLGLPVLFWMPVACVRGRMSILR